MTKLLSCMLPISIKILHIKDIKTAFQYRKNFRSTRNEP